MKQLQIKQLIVGELQSNCYLLYENDSRQAFIIDPGDAADYIVTIINELKLIPLMIIATHGHFDHILAAGELQMNFNLPFLINKRDVFLINQMQDSASYWLKHQIAAVTPKVTEIPSLNKALIIGKSKLEIIDTPGHTPGSICLYSKRNKLLFSGDTIFNNGTGRTDFSYSSDKQMKSSLVNILKLPANTMLLSGHGQTFLLGEYQKIADSYKNL